MRSNARAYLHVYVKRGKILKPATCSVEGCIEKPEAHHRDYSKPLEVEWICRKHHMEKHSTRGEYGDSSSL